jgi:NhaA family Na+:H+ antiporter
VLSPVNFGIRSVLENLWVIGFCWLASKFKLATLSNEISWLQLTGAACLVLVLLCQLLLLVQL